MLKSRRTLILTLILAVLVIVFIVSTYMVISIVTQQEQEKEAFDVIAESVKPLREERVIDPPKKEAAKTPRDDEIPTVLPEYEELYTQNPDMFGWIYIEGTKIDYPVMYTPEEPEYYLRRAFDGSSTQSGTPFIDGACAPDGDFYLIYGHHIKNGSMFGSLTKYADKTWRDEHRVICFDTLYERREYEVVAAFYADASLDEGDGFLYYKYTDLSDRDVFDEYVRQVSEVSIYKEAVDAEYGDELIALSTCSYHTGDGRFVVVAKRISRQSVPENVYDR